MVAWPTSTVEYGSFGWLRREVSQALGLPADVRLLDHVDRSRVDSIIESGLHLFYYPNPSTFTLADATEAQKERLRRAPHQWTFLQTSTTVGMVVGQSSYDLPANFATFLDEPTTSRSGERISIASAGQLRQLLSSAPHSGPPRYVAVEPKDGDGTGRQRYVMIVYPTPSESEEIVVRHGIVPAMLTSAKPFPSGGMEHAETILACCLHVASERSPSGLDEMREQKMRDRLVASVLQDVHHGQPGVEGVWPVDEEEGGLSINRQYLSRLVGRDLGYGPNRHAWTYQQGKTIEECIKSGLRRFYAPPVLPDERYPHSWTFLEPIGGISLREGESVYQLPVGLSMVIGGMTFVDQKLHVSPLIRQATEELVRHRIEQFKNLRGLPEMFAVRNSNEAGHEGRRLEAIFWRVPDRDYEVEYRYRIDPLMLAMNDSEAAVPGVMEGETTPRGSDVHAQTIIESCLLSASELMRRDRRETEERLLRFMRCLVASVGFDRKIKAGSTVGYNGDRSSDDRPLEYRDLQSRVVKYNGVTY